MGIQMITQNILQNTEKFNCGSTLFTLLPFVIFIIYSYRLSQIYVKTTCINNNNLNFRHNVPRNQWWNFILKNLFMHILVWILTHFWSGGLIYFLKAYTLPFIIMINNCLKNKNKMNYTTLITIEHYSKLIVCYMVSFFMHLCCIYVNNNYNRTARRSRRRPMYEWPVAIFRIDDIDELGENGYLLMQNIVPPEFDHSLQYTNNNNLIQLKQTQSCPLIVKKTKKTFQKTKRNNSL